MLLMHFSLGLVLGSPNFIWLQKINFLLTTMARFLKRGESESSDLQDSSQDWDLRGPGKRLKNNICVFFPLDCLSTRKEMAILRRNKSEARLLALSQPMAESQPQICE